MKKPIYLYVTAFFPGPETWEGGYCYDMVRALMRTNDEYDIRVFVARGGVDYIYHDIPVSRYAAKELPCGLAPFLLSGLNGQRFIAALRAHGIEPKDVAVCHVHTNCLAYVTESIKKANPRTLTLLHHHNINPFDLRAGRLGELPLHSMFLYLYYRKLFEQVDVHVFCSEKSRRSYGKLYVEDVPELGFETVRNRLLLGRWMRDVRMTDSYVYYNGYDKQVFSPVAPRRHDGFVVGCVANFFTLKDHDTLLRAFAEFAQVVPEATLKLIGSGPTLEPSRALVRALGISDKISISAEIDHLDLPRFYHSLDLFVMASRTEGFSCAFIEALGCGVPIVGCRGISIEEAFDDDNRRKWLAPPRSPHQLAERMIEYYRRRYPYQLIQDFTTDGIAKRFWRWLEKFRRSSCA